MAEKLEVASDKLRKLARINQQAGVLGINEAKFRRRQSLPNDSIDYYIKGFNKRNFEDDDNDGKEYSENTKETFIDRESSDVHDIYNELTNRLEITQRASDIMKCLSHTAESLQKHSELNKKLDEVILENRMQQLYKLAEIDISKMDEKFQAEWHSHNLILIGDLARQYHDFTLMNEINQNVAMILLEVVGDEAEKKKILGFAFHNIGKTYQISKKYSEAFSAYGAAFSVYSKSKDWINESNRKSLMQKLEKDSSYMKYAQREIDIPGRLIQKTLNIEKS
uniref:uncharacterized protein LOC120329017 n=1 Tax=Styela clava TaxID=7725 RepID=UPI001939F663|nr:uncharacterized protein LOC120329017 [Styela clava]